MKSHFSPIKDNVSTAKIQSNKENDIPREAVVVRPLEVRLHKIKALTRASSPRRAAPGCLSKSGLTKVVTEKLQEKKAKTTEK